MIVRPVPTRAMLVRTSLELCALFVARAVAISVAQAASAASGAAHLCGQELIELAQQEIGRVARRQQCERSDRAQVEQIEASPAPRGVS